MRDRLVKAIVCWLLLWCGHAAAQTLALTDAQREWVAAHPVLRLGMAREYPPFYFSPAAPARPYGFVVETIDLWADRVGMKVDIVRFDDNLDALRALKEGRVDMVPFASGGAGVLEGLHTLPIFAGTQVLVARRELPDISPTDNFGRYRVAVVERTPAAALLARRFPQANLVPYRSPEEALRAVASGSADLFVGYQQVVVYHIEKLLLANLAIRRSLGPGEVPVGPVVRQDALELRGVLGRAIESVTAADRSAIAGRWLPAGTLTAAPGDVAALTAAERAWVEQHGRIAVGFDGSFAPITSVNELGEAAGLGIDYMRLVARKAGLSITREAGASFASMYAGGLTGDVQVVVGAVRTPERKADYDFVGPFVRIPTAIVGRANEAVRISDLREAGGRKVALLRQHFLMPELRARHPGIQLVEFDRQDEVLAALSDGRADVALGNMKVINQLIEVRHAGMLRITGTVLQGDSELYFAVPRSRPELTQILRKGLDAVSDAESDAIVQRWTLVNLEQGLAWRELLVWGGPVLLALLIGMTLLWRSRQHMWKAREVEARGRAMAEEASASRGRFLAYLTHELRGTLGAAASGADIARADTDARTQARLLDAVAQSLRGLSEVLETTLSFEQTLLKPMQLQPEPVQLQVLWTRLAAGGELAARRKGIEFQSRCDAGDAVVMVDAPRLLQVAMNLIHNAVKFTAQGRVEVTACWTRLGEASGPRWLALSVRDSGPGLTPEELGRIFEPYHQGVAGERMREGLGLGLAISRQIVAAMGGTLEATSTPGQGATFTVTVPLVLVRVPADAALQPVG